jgi:hypothetical protein
MVTLPRISEPAITPINAKALMVHPRKRSLRAFTAVSPRWRALCTYLQRVSRKYLRGGVVSHKREGFETR